MHLLKLCLLLAIVCVQVCDRRILWSSLTSLHTFLYSSKMMIRLMRKHFGRDNAAVDGHGKNKAVLFMHVKLGFQFITVRD